MNKDREAGYLEKVTGINKERDYSIIKLHSERPDLTHAEILKYLNIDLVEERISQILTDNSALCLDMFVKENPLATPEGRNKERAKHYLKKKLASGKDPVDILDSMETKNTLVNIEQHTHYTVIRNEKEYQEKLNERNSSQIKLPTI